MSIESKPCFSIDLLLFSFLSAYTEYDDFSGGKNMIIYTVKSGDSVYSIAREFNVPPTRIVTDNALANPSRLTVGQSLAILYPMETYTVKGGDTLNSIANATGASLGELWRNNPVLGGTANVYPGQVLNIRYPEQEYGEISTNGYVYPFVERAVLRRTLPYLTYLSIFSYGFKEDGTLLPPNGGDDEIIALAKEYGTVPILTLTSITEKGTFSSELVEKLLSSDDLLESVASELVRTAQEKGYGGIDLDFEYIPAQYAEVYASFAELLRNMLPDGFVVFTSLAPKTSADQRGLLYEGHNYRLIGESADRVLLMTYEWGYTYGPPLAVAPLPQVRRVIEYALTEIPAEKIFMGIPNYGYDWKLPYVRGESKAQSISNEEALRIAMERKAQIQYDELAQTPYFTYYAANGSGGVSEHVVWFDDVRSMNTKLRIINEYGLFGGGVWNVMKYFPGLWTVMNSLYKIRKQ